MKTVFVEGSGYGCGPAFELRRSKKNAAAPGQMMVEVEMRSGLRQWVSPARVKSA